MDGQNQPDPTTQTVMGDASTRLQRIVSRFQGKPMLVILVFAILFAGFFAYGQLNKAEVVAFKDFEKVLARGRRYNKNFTNNAEYESVTNNSETLSVQEIEAFTIEAEDYDEGGQGSAYFDTRAGNSGGEYRQDDVDIEQSGDVNDDGFNVGWIDSQEWLSYEFETQNSGSYDVSVRIARQLWEGDFPANFRLELDGDDISGTLVAENTGGWQNWTTLQDGTVFIEAGTHKLVFRALENDGRTNLMNLNWIRFTPSDADDEDNIDDTAPTDDGEIATAFTVQAEDYGDKGFDVSYWDSNSGNAGGEYRDDDVDIELAGGGDEGYNVGWIHDGEWLKFDIDVMTSAKYDIEARVARQLWEGDHPANFRLELDGNDISGLMVVEDTGGWHNWVTISGPQVEISEGFHELAFRVTDNGGKTNLMNLNWLRFVPDGVVDDDPEDDGGDDGTDPGDNPGDGGGDDGGGDDFPPPSGDTSVGPRTISCTGVTINAGSSISDAANNNPAGTTFCIKAGTYNSQSVTPKDNQRFIGELGATLNGQDNANHAFRSSASGVRIENLVLTNYNTPQQQGLVQTDGGNSWTIVHNVISEAYGGGIHMSGGDDHYIANNYIHHNHQNGITTNFGDGVVIEYNEIAYNNYLQEFAWGWEAGGSKFWSMSNMTIRGNESHHNHGPGLWTDNDNIHILYEDNVVHNNFSPGIFHEISFDAIIRNNHVYNNGWGRLGELNEPWNPFLTASGIQVSASSNVEVYGNTVEGNAQGITGMDQCRSDNGTNYQLINVRVYDNDLVNTGYSGAASDCGSSIDYQYSNNNLSGNSYIQ